VESPAKNRHAELVVKTTESGVLVITTATLPSQDCKALECNVECDGGSAGPPDKRVSNEVDLTVVFTPEVDASLQYRP